MDAQSPRHGISPPPVCLARQDQAPALGERVAVDEDVGLALGEDWSSNPDGFSERGRGEFGIR